METDHVPRRTKRQEVFTVSWVATIVISVLVHIAVLVFLGLLPGLPVQLVSSGGNRGERKFRLRIERPVEKKDALADREKEEEKQPSFMKTPPEESPIKPPTDSPYVGARAMVAEGGPKAPNDIKEMPAQDGEKPKASEIVLFDQNRQDGALEHMRDGTPSRMSPRVPMPLIPDAVQDPARVTRPGPSVADGREASPMIPQIETPDAREFKEGPLNREQKPVDDTTLVRQEDETAQAEKSDNKENNRVLADNDRGSKDDVEGTEEEGKRTETGGNELLAAALRDTMDFSDMLPNARKIEVPTPGSKGKDLPETGQMPLKVPQVEPRLPAPSLAERGAEQASPPKPKVYYDPAFTAENQPGFKTHERKTRTTGRFSFGRKAAVNVDPTPMGRYQEIIYRAIGACWYRQADLNQDVIIPGMLRIRILVDTKGKVTDMRLLNKHGASTAQKSFTFLAIKQADIPPMPPEVVRELVGDKLELFFDFHF